jgi:hypothetical protein
MSMPGPLAVVVGVPIGMMMVVLVTGIMPVMVIFDTGLAFTAAANRTHYWNSCCLVFASDQSYRQRREKRQPYDFISVTENLRL